MNIKETLHNRMQHYMKNFGRIFILCCSLLLVLSGCSSESPVDPPPPVILEKGYLSFDLSVGKALTTRTFDGTTDGTVGERYVQSVRIVLYDGETDNSKVIHAFNYNIKSTDSGTDVWEGSDLAPTTDKTNSGHFITYAREVSDMDYKMLAIINPTTAMKTATAVGKALNDFRQAQKIEGDSKTSDIGNMALDKNFVMTNSQGLVNITSSQNLHNTQDAAHAAPISVSVERVVAKVTLKVPTIDNSIPVKNVGAQAANLTWGLDITNKWTFWMRRGTEASTAGREYWYAVDPNYYKTSSLDEANIKEEFFYYSSQNIAPSTLPNILDGSEYCLENTMELAEQTVSKVATRVLIRCTYKPQDVNTLGDGYYVILDDTNPNAPAETYTLDNMRSLVEQAKHEETIGQISRVSQLVLNAINQGYDLSTGGVPAYKGNAVTASFETNNIRYYHNGVNYYAIKILHFGEDDNNITFGHYGVLRNTHYTVILQSIQGSGAVNLESAEISTRSAIVGRENSIYDNIVATVVQTQ